MNRRVRPRSPFVARNYRPVSPYQHDDDYFHQRDNSPPPRRSRSRFSEDCGRSDYPPGPPPMDRRLPMDRGGSIDRERRRSEERRLDRGEPVNREDEEDGVLYFSDCVMFPPRNGIDKPVFQKTKKTDGCKTLYFGGLPEEIVRIPKRLELIFREVFSANGGSIDVVRISPRGFCHMRFMKEESIEIAMTLCGYWMEIKQGYESPIRFRMMMDYAQSQTDAEEYEAKKLIAAKLNIENRKIPAIPSYNSSAVDTLCADLKDPEAYVDATIVLRYWMCSNLNKQTSVKFFNMLQVSSQQIRRLQNEKLHLDDQFNSVQRTYRHDVESMQKEFDQLYSLYTDTQQQKLWDNFTKPQRKSISNWLDTLRNSISSAEKSATESTEENTDSNVQSSKKKRDISKEPTESQDVATLKMSLAGMQQQVWEMIGKLQAKDLQIEEKQKEIDDLKDIPAVPAKRRRKEKEGNGAPDIETAKLICVLATFLQVYPDGASTQCIIQYLAEECNIQINANELDLKLSTMNGIFTNESNDVNGEAINKWKYVLMKKMIT